MTRLASVIIRDRQMLGSEINKALEGVGFALLVGLMVDVGETIRVAGGYGGFTLASSVLTMREGVVPVW